MTTDNEALKLANTVPELQSLLYDVGLMPEQLDPTGIGYKRMLAIVEAYKVGIQTGRDQVLKELAEQEPYCFGLTPSGIDAEEYLDITYKNTAAEKLETRGWKVTALIPQPTMPPIKEKE